MKTIVICAGGPEEEVIPLASFVNDQTLFIGADRGTLRLMRAGIIPDAAVGDFDSVSEEEWNRIEATGCLIERRFPEKDETDTELALELAYTWEAERIILTGVTGGRLDHMFSAVQLLIRHLSIENDARLLIMNRQNELSLLDAGTFQVQLDERLPYISFFSMTERVTGISLRGMKYEVNEQDIHFGDTRFTSNEIVSPTCTISLQAGICLMVRSSDS